MDVGKSWGDEEECMGALHCSVDWTLADGAFQQ